MHDDFKRMTAKSIKVKVGPFVIDENFGCEVTTSENKLQYVTQF